MSKITDLTAQVPANFNLADVIAMVDLSDTTMAPSGTTKKLTLENLRRALGMAAQSIAAAQTQADGTAAYADLATTGPQVTLETGTFVLVVLSMRYAHRNPGIGYMAVDISGATTHAAVDSEAVVCSPQNTLIHSVTQLLVLSVTAGSNTFTAKYRNAAAGSGTPTFSNRTLVVIPLN